MQLKIKVIKLLYQYYYAKKKFESTHTPIKIIIVSPIFSKYKVTSTPKVHTVHENVLIDIQILLCTTCQ